MSEVKSTNIERIYMRNMRRVLDCLREVFIQQKYIYQYIYVYIHTRTRVCGQGCLACCSPWGCKESDMTERLN